MQMGSELRSWDFNFHKPSDLNRIFGINQRKHHLMEIGSEWRRWDLHVHTPYSFHQKFKFSSDEERKYFGNNIWNKYINELRKVFGVSVIGITDYFTIEGYKKVLEYRQNGWIKNFDLILPNIEFRLDKMNDGKRLNYHVIFSNEISTSDIEEKFLHELHINNSDENLALTNTNIEAIGHQLKEEHPNFTGSDFIVGCTNITVSLDEIIKVLNEKHETFENKYLLFATNDLDDLNWDGQGHLTRKQILKRSHGMFSSNDNTRSFLLGKKHESVEEYISEFKSLKPCVHGSDAHSFEKICEPDEDNFCWIKADPSFEGLKQIIYEPEERVVVQKDYPGFRKIIYTLKSIEIRNSIINDNLSVKEDYIPLNKNLVVITGGKGSGKTALLDLIANCFIDRCKRNNENKKDTNSFIQRIENDKGDLEVKIGFIDEKIGKFAKKISDEELFENSKIMYLPQGKIEEYSGNKTKLSDIIKEIISTNENVIKSSCNEKNRRYEEEIRKILENIESINKDIDQLDKKTDMETFNKVDKELKIKKGELKDKEDKFEEFKQRMKENKVESIENLKETQKELINKHGHLASLKEKLEDLNTKFENCQTNSNNLLDNLNDEILKVDIDIYLPKLNFNTQFDVISQILELLQDKNEATLSDIAKIENDLNELSGDSKVQAKLIEDLESIKGNIKIIEKELKVLKENKDRIESLESERFEKYVSLLNKYNDWKTYFNSVIDIFSTGESKSKILKEVFFEPEIHFNVSDFNDLGYKLLNKKKTPPAEIDKISTDLHELVSKVPVEKKELENFIKRLMDKKENLIKGHTPYEFYEWIFGDYYSLKIEVLYNDTPINKLSMGQKGTILLSLFLSEGDYPLIIDQPEDNLDNKFVYDVLKGAFREAKTKRQIIIATNNANLVVNTDAEQIIIAEFNDGQIAYKKGSLENPIMCNDIIPVLEGGEEAFRQREKKYGISLSK